LAIAKEWRISKVNVLLISPLPPPAGGISSWTKGYLESRKALENNILIVNSAVIDSRVKDFNKRDFFEEWKRTRNILSDLKKRLSGKQIELVHLNSSCGKFGLLRDCLCAFAVKQNGISLITHFHCDVSYMVRGKTNLFLLRKLVSASDVVLTLNEVSKQFVMEKCGKTSIILPNFVSDEFSYLISADKVIKENIENILFVGHVQDAKGCHVIYETAKLFPEIQFNLLGFISDKFKKMDKPVNIALFGEVSKEQVKIEMLKADLFLLPTHTEGFPTVLVEAMACGLPVIATPVGAIPDMIEKDGGILVPVNDVTAVSKAILALQDKGIRTKISCWNKQKVNDNYRMDQIMNQLFEIYAQESRGE
jgi:glycosyltransferase involved in cell wall biosynthesis